MFNRSEFYSFEAKHGHVKSPTEYIVSTMRYTGQPASVAHPEWYVGVQGQNLLQPPNVAGWKPNRNWVSTSTMWSRANFARNIMWTAKTAGFLAGTTTVSIQTAAQRVFDAFGIDAPSQATRTNVENYVYAERYAKGWGETQNLIQLGMLCPEFQAG